MTTTFMVIASLTLQADAKRKGFKAVQKMLGGLQDMQWTGFRVIRWTSVGLLDRDVKTQDGGFKLISKHKEKKYSCSKAYLAQNIYGERMIIEMSRKGKTEDFEKRPAIKMSRKFEKKQARILCAEHENNTYLCNKVPHDFFKNKIEWNAMTLLGLENALRERTGLEIILTSPRPFTREKKSRNDIEIAYEVKLCSNNNEYLLVVSKEGKQEEFQKKCKDLIDVYGLQSVEAKDLNCDRKDPRPLAPRFANYSRGYYLMEYPGSDIGKLRKFHALFEKDFGDNELEYLVAEAKMTASESKEDAHEFVKIAKEVMNCPEMAWRMTDTFLRVLKNLQEDGSFGEKLRKDWGNSLRSVALTKIKHADDEHASEKITEDIMRFPELAYNITISWAYMYYGPSQTFNLGNGPYQHALKNLAKCGKITTSKADELTKKWNMTVNSYHLFKLLNKAFWNKDISDKSCDEFLETAKWIIKTPDLAYEMTLNGTYQRALALVTILQRHEYITPERAGELKREWDEAAQSFKDILEQENKSKQQSNALRNASARRRRR